MELKYRFIFIQPTAKEITCPVSHSRCAQKQSLSVAAQSPNPRESRIDRSPARAPRRQPLPPPSQAGEGIALWKREKWEELYRPPGGLDGHTCSSWGPAGVEATPHLCGEDVLEDAAAAAAVLRCSGHCVSQVEQG